MTAAAAAAPWRRGLHGWQMRSTASGRCSEPADLDDETDAPWQDAAAAGTIAAMLRESGQWSLDDSPRRFDAEDWWLRCDVDFDPACDFAPIALHLGGLAGLADVWVNGRHLLRSENMFLSHTLALDSAWLPGRNRIHLRFESLDAALAVRRPRPRWRAPMIEQQQLRWFRQTVLGRAPGWTPPAAPVGLWREAWLECGAGAPLRDIDLRPELDAHGVGWVEASLRCAVPRASRIELTRWRSSLRRETRPGGRDAWPSRRRHSGGRIPTVSRRSTWCTCGWWSKRAQHRSTGRCRRWAFAAWRSTPPMATSRSASTASRCSAAVPAGCLWTS
jgi:hypothetical protein